MIAKNDFIKFWAPVQHFSGISTMLYVSRTKMCEKMSYLGLLSAAKLSS